MRLVTEEQIRAWKGSGHPRKLIAAAIAEWVRMWPSASRSPGERTRVGAAAQATASRAATRIPGVGRLGDPAPGQGRPWPGFESRCQRLRALDKGKGAVEFDSAPSRRGDEHGIEPALLEALAGLGPEDRQAISQVIALHREFPAWAVWLPYRGRRWAAVRPASARAPGPDLPMIWVHADTAAELAARLRGADAQMAPP